MSLIATIKLSTLSLTVLLLASCGGGKSNSGTGTPSSKKIFLIGDSTMHIHSSEYLLNTVRMTCGTDNPENILTGWGDELHHYAKNPSNIINRARAGSSSVSYRTDENYDNDKFGINRHWTHTKALMEIEDSGILLIQFGTGNENNHAPKNTDYDNDGDIDRDDEILRRALRKNNYEEAMGNYIKEARDIGFTPILLSPPDSRIKGTAAAGTHPHTREEFPGYIRQLGITHGVTVLDLNAKSNQEFAKLTDAELLRDFGDCAKNQGRGTIDRTHYEPQGARTVAGWVKELACATTVGDNDNDKKLLCEQFNSSGEGQPTTNDTIYEDAEDGNTNGWSIFDNSPSGSSFSNTFDQSKESNIIQFSGDGINNGYMLGNVDGQSGAWNNTKSTKVEWSMNYTNTFKVYFNVRTDNWTGYIYYSPINTDEGVVTAGNSTFVHLGLGTQLRNGTWQTITRDLQEDLQKFESSNTIRAVNGIFIRGNGSVDDIKVIAP